jgi:glycosyltransferase involved in cell wall biosynthesis
MILPAPAVALLSKSNSNHRRRRVGVDFHTFDGIFQGSRSHLLGIYLEAIRLAPEIDFVFFLAEPDKLIQAHPAFVRANVRLVHMPHRPSIMRLGLQLAWHQWREQLDVLHVQYRLPFVPLGRCACTIHDVLFESHPQFFSANFVRIARATSRMAVRQADLLFTVSEYSRDQICNVYSVPPERVSVTYNGVDTSRFFQGEAGADVPARYGLTAGNYLCCIGRLEPRKNHLSLIRAYAALGQNQPPLAIIGQRDFSFDAAFAEVSRLGLQSNIKFLEDVSDTDMPALLRHARVFIYPSYAEGFGMPVAEAMASGVPVITSSTTSLPEVSGAAAILVHPDDIVGLSEALRNQLQASPDARAQRVALGLQQIDKFAWHLAAQVLIDGFQSLPIGR